MILGFLILPLSVGILTAGIHLSRQLSTPIRARFLLVSYGMLPIAASILLTIFATSLVRHSTINDPYFLLGALSSVWLAGGLFTLCLCGLGHRGWQSIKHTRLPSFSTVRKRGLAVVIWILSYMAMWNLFYQQTHPRFTHVTTLLTTEVTHLIAIPWLVLLGVGCTLPIITILIIPCIQLFYRLFSQYLHYSRNHQQQASSHTKTDLGNRIITLFETSDIEPRPRIIEQTDPQYPPNISAGRSLDGTPTLIVNTPQETISNDTDIQLIEPSVLAILQHEAYHLKNYHSVIQLILIPLMPFLGGKSAVYTLFDRPAMEFEADQHAAEETEPPSEASEHPLTNALQEFARLRDYWRARTILTTLDEANPSNCEATHKLRDAYRATVLLLWHPDRADILRPSIKDRIDEIRDT